MSDTHPPAAYPVTTGPKFHWFGYYDKLQFDPTGRYLLAMEVDFEHRSPRPEDEIRVGMIDLQDGNRWIALGHSRAWCWQQGCMLQWIPGRTGEVIWNDRGNDGFVCHILDVQSGRRRTLDHPIYALAPDGRTAIGTDFRRIQHMRPGYGYAGIPDPHRDDPAPPDSGIYRLDLTTGEAQLLLSLADVTAIPNPRRDAAGAKHYFNHLLFNPYGSRFIFLHRWRLDDDPFHTRLMTGAADGSDLRVMDDYGHTSHFIWRDPQHILAWAWRPSHEWGYYLFADGAEAVSAVGQGQMHLNGHCTYLPGGEWILNDTYPVPERNRHQELYLYHPLTDRRVSLGAFFAPPAYAGEWRCDLHPRSSPDGRYVSFDSAHGGNGRQIYLIDLAATSALRERD